MLEWSIIRLARHENRELHMRRVAPAESLKQEDRNGAATALLGVFVIVCCYISVSVL